MLLAYIVMGIDVHTCASFGKGRLLLSIIYLNAEYFVRFQSCVSRILEPPLLYGSALLKQSNSLILPRADFGRACPSCHLTLTFSSFAPGGGSFGRGLRIHFWLLLWLVDQFRFLLRNH